MPSALLAALLQLASSTLHLHQEASCIQSCTACFPCERCWRLLQQSTEQVPSPQVHPSAAHGGILFDPAFQRVLLRHIVAAVHDQPKPPVQEYAPPPAALLSHRAAVHELHKAARQPGRASLDLREAGKQLQAAVQQLDAQQADAAQPVGLQQASEVGPVSSRTRRAAGLALN